MFGRRVQFTILKTLVGFTAKKFKKKKHSSPSNIFTDEDMRGYSKPVSK